MQDRIQTAASNRIPAPPAAGASAPDAPLGSAAPPATATPNPAPPEEPSRLDQSLTNLRDTLDEHNGKLAISAAAMLGLLVYYKWGERSLAKENPAEYERLRRFRESLRHVDYGRRAGDKPLPGSSEKLKK